MRIAIFVVALAAAAGMGWFVTQGSRDAAAPRQDTPVQDVTPTEAESDAAYFVSTSIPPVLQIAGEPLVLSTLEERMAFHGVPGVSIAFLRDHQVEWTLTAGVRDVVTGEPVDENTVFQAASISKPTFATTLMMYRQSNPLDLDADINTLLTRWQLPAHAWQDSQPVTLRRLLSHNAGTSVHGFRGYAAGEPVPTMIELLEGRAPSASDPVIVDVEPGSRYRYSGGGTTLAHMAFEDQSGLTLDAAAQAYVFEPLGMTRSAYSQPLSGPLTDNAATAHGSDGQPIPGGPHNYAPIMGAAGLWTTPSDLMRMAGSLQRAHTGTDTSWMRQDTANAMLSSQFEGLGIGFRVGGEDAITHFHHGGSNAGFRARFFAHTDSGDGIAIMTNSSNGSDLIYEILTIVSRYYGWEDGWDIEVKEVVEMSEARLDSFTGQYILARPDRLPTSISRDGDILLLNARPYMIDIPLRPDGEDSFFAMNGMAVNFTRDAAGDVVSFTFYGGVLAERVEEGD